MGRMIDGRWTTEWYEPDEEGAFKRPQTVFRNRVRADGSTEHEPESGRYHLYVAYACPWAHRTLIVRQLKGLDEAISISVVHPLMGDDGWTFDPEDGGGTEDTLLGKRFLREVYAEADPRYTGRVTVPVLWDKKRHTIVNNESREIVRMLDCEFENCARSEITLYPEGYRDKIDEVIDAIYGPINDGVYRCGFAASQKAYDRAVGALFEALDHWEQVLEDNRYLCGEVFTEADVFMFTTLFRFDLVYHTHFKCNVRQLREYPNLWNYVKEIYQMEGVAETTHIGDTKWHYFGSHGSLNPSGIVPAGPDIDFDEPHDRDRLPGRLARVS